MPQQHLPATDVASILREWLQPLAPLAPKVRTDRLTGNLHVRFTAGRVPEGQLRQIRMLIQSFAGSSIDPTTGDPLPHPRYFRGNPNGFTFGNSHVFLHGPASDTPHIRFDVESLLPSLAESPDLPWGFPKS